MHEVATKNRVPKATDVTRPDRFALKSSGRDVNQHFVMTQGNATEDHFVAEEIFLFNDVFDKSFS